MAGPDQCQFRRGAIATSSCTWTECWHCLAQLLVLGGAACYTERQPTPPSGAWKISRLQVIMHDHAITGLMDCFRCWMRAQSATTAQRCARVQARVRALPVFVADIRAPRTLVTGFVPGAAAAEQYPTRQLAPAGSLTATCSSSRP